MSNVCPNCGFPHLRHKGKKEIYNDHEGKRRTKWTQPGQQCKRCGWESFE